MSKWNSLYPQQAERNDAYGWARYSGRQGKGLLNWTKRTNQAMLIFRNCDEYWLVYWISALIYIFSYSMLGKESCCSQLQHRDCEIRKLLKSVWCFWC